MKSSKINAKRKTQGLLIIIMLVITGQLSAQTDLSLLTTSLTNLITSTAAMADIDGDNDLDVLIAGEEFSSGFPNYIELYTNDGSGNFTQVNSIPFKPISNGDIEFADVDGDNDQDVLIVGYSLHLSNGALINYSIAELYLNDGAGNFTLASGTPFTPSSNATIAFADIDHDNDQDVCITGNSGTATYINNETGSFTVGTTFSTFGQGDVKFGDINGDTHIDLLLTGNYLTELYTNDGTGSFTLLVGTPFPNIAFSSLGLVDVNGDNHLDVFIVGRISPSVSTSESKLYLNNGTGIFTLQSGTSFAFSSSVNLAFSDIDGDNDQDLYLATANAQANNGIYYNDGTGVFHFDNSKTVDRLYKGKAIFGDVDGNNTPDLFVIGNNGSGGQTNLYKNTFATKANKSIDFDGTNTFAATHLAALNTLPMTVEFWAKIPASDTDISFIKKTNGSGNEFNIYTSGGIVHAKYGTDASNYTTTQSATTLNDDNWHHIAFTVNATNSQLYIDGVLAQTSNWTGTAAAISNTNNLILGVGTANYNGLLDEVRIWNTTRTALEIRSNMYTSITNSTSNAALIAYYNINEYSTTTLFDKSQQYNAAKITGGTATLADELISYTNATTSSNSSVQNTTATIGNLTFDDTNNPFDAAVEIVVAQVSGAPNIATGITEANIDNKYYIVQLYNGAGTYSVNLSIATNAPNGTAVTLYRRDDHSTGGWTVLASGTVVGGKAVFNNITSFSQLMMASSTSLPVELLSFTASAEIEAVRLNWSVGIEDNLSHYEIERSIDGRDFAPNASSVSWKNIGAVSAKGLSFYEFQDFDIANNNVFYYRLKAVDFNDSYEYSKVIQITLRQSKNQAIDIYPNPATGDFVNIHIESKDATISLLNNTGKIINHFQSTNGTSQIDISNLPSGLYYISIRSNGVQTVKKLIVE